MKKIIVIIIIHYSLLISHCSFSQSSWISTFFNKTPGISKIVKKDSLNYFAFSYSYKYFFKSIDAGNNWSYYKEYTIDTNCSIFDGQFINSQIGWIVGETNETFRGFISKTINGGVNWIFVNTGFDNWDSRCLSFINENTGWIGGHIGVLGCLFKTINGGINWSKVEFQGAVQINSVKFFDSNNGWVITEDSAVYRTTNGGNNWTRIQINNIIQPANYVFYRYLYPLNNNEIWALVIRNAGLIFSHVYRTIDGGNNWSLQFTHTDSLSSNAHAFLKINFINSTTGFLYGGFNFIFKTTNAGMNWNKINILIANSYYPEIIDLYPKNESEILAAGGQDGTLDYILKSTNIGNNWITCYLNSQFDFSKVKFVDINTGFLISENDTLGLYKTTNNGVNWRKIFNSSNNWYHLIAFANSSTGCVSTSTNSNIKYGKILRTTNCGDNWTEVYNTSDLSVYSLMFVNQLYGFAGCDGNKLLKTTNSGIIWSVLSLVVPYPSYTFDILDVNFIDNNTGWVLGHHFHTTLPPYGSYERNIIWKTTDSGINWNIIFDSVGSDYFCRINFINVNTGYRLSSVITSINKLQRTTNGGVNWINFSVPYLIYPSSIKFINQNTGWLGGRTINSFFYGLIFKTTNSGLNWFLQYYNTDNVICLDAVDDNHAWFCGSQSCAYKTTNGGGFIGINSVINKIPDHFSLSQNYPNPFNPSTKIKFTIPPLSFQHVLSWNPVKLIMFDILGKEVTTLVNENLKPGEYEVTFDASTLPSGIYFYTLSTNDFKQTKKMILLK
jgi:photosystem II stability/assembly factor-like uncharacterized protein